MVISYQRRVPQRQGHHLSAGRRVFFHSPQLGRVVLNFRVEPFRHAGRERQTEEPDWPALPERVPAGETRV